MTTDFVTVPDPCGCGPCNVCHLWRASLKPENRIREYHEDGYRVPRAYSEDQRQSDGEWATSATDAPQPDEHALWRVISLRGRWPKSIKPGEFVYVGRAFAGLEAHPLGNPFTGPTAVERYTAWIQRHPDREELLRELHADTEGGRIPIACWCGDWKPGEEPIQCHACVLAKLMAEQQ
jgi:hypothetical protein